MHDIRNERNSAGGSELWETDAKGAGERAGPDSYALLDERYVNGALTAEDIASYSPAERLRLAQHYGVGLDPGGAPASDRMADEALQERYANGELTRDDILALPPWERLAAAQQYGIMLGPGDMDEDADRWLARPPAR